MMTRKKLTQPIPKTLIFLGTDGSGKSTHAHIIFDKLKSEGKTVKYVWMHRVAYFSLPLLGICRILGITKVRRFKNGKHWISEYPFYYYPALKIVWPMLQFLDSTVHMLFTVSLPRIKNPELFVIIDRGIIDTFVDVTIDTGLPSESGMSKFYLTFIPKNSFIALFDVDERVAMERKTDIPSISYLTKRRQLYLILAKKYNWPTFFTENRLSKVQNDLLTAIREWPN